MKGEDVLALLAAKKKGKRQKNKGRKVGRNFRWEYTTHSMTKYRANGRREKNKARRAAQRQRRLARAASRHRERNGISEDS